MAIHARPTFAFRLTCHLTSSTVALSPARDHNMRLSIAGMVGWSKSLALIRKSGLKGGEQDDFRQEFPDCRVDYNCYRRGIIGCIRRDATGLITYSDRRSEIVSHPPKGLVAGSFKRAMRARGGP